jgi:hypothetical protein
VRIDRTWRDRLIGGVRGRMAKTTGSSMGMNVMVERALATERSHST